MLKGSQSSLPYIFNRTVLKFGSQVKTKHKRSLAQIQGWAESIVSSEIIVFKLKLTCSQRAKIRTSVLANDVQFKVKHSYLRGIDKIKGHILRFVNLRHIQANLTVTYGF